jgi:hypothetical protein
MMQRALLTGLTLAALQGAAYAESPRVLWNGTGTGGMRVSGAEVQQERGAVTAFGSYLTQGGLVAPGDDVSRTRYGFAGLYAPLEYLELGAGVHGASITNTLSNPERLASFGDVRLAAKGAYKISDALATGVRAQLLLFSGVKDSAGGSESGYGDTASYAGEWVSSFRKGGFASHLALGYLYDRTVNFHPGVPTPQERFAWGQNDFNQLTYGLAAAYETEAADYLLEVSGEQPVGSNAPAFTESPVRVTPGVRLRPWGPLEVQIGADIALTNGAGRGLPAQPGYDLLAALRWHVDLGAAAPAPEAPAATPAPAVEAPAEEAPVSAPAPASAPVQAEAQFGALTGRVLNMATGAPVGGAKVAVEGVAAPVMTTPSGNFVLARVPAGEVTVRVAADGLRDGSATGQVKAGGVATLDVGLEPLVTTGAVVVTVTAGGQPAADAEVLVNGAKAGVTGKDGAFTAKDVKAGTVEVAVRKDGFKPAETAFLEVTAGQTVRETFRLEPEARPGFIEVKAVNEERLPVAATVTVEGQPDLQRALDPAAGATTTYKLAPGTYRIRVEAKGYKPEVQEVQLPEDGELALRFKLTK